MYIRLLMRVLSFPLPVSPGPLSSYNQHQRQVLRAPCSDRIPVGHQMEITFIYHHRLPQLEVGPHPDHSGEAPRHLSFSMSRAIYPPTRRWLRWMWTAHLILATFLGHAIPRHAAPLATRICYCITLFRNLRFRPRNCVLPLPVRRLGIARSISIAPCAHYPHPLRLHPHHVPAPLDLDSRRIPHQAAKRLALPRRVHLALLIHVKTCAQVSVICHGTAVGHRRSTIVTGNGADRSTLVIIRSNHTTRRVPLDLTIVVPARWKHPLVPPTPPPTTRARFGSRSRLAVPLTLALLHLALRRRPRMGIGDTTRRDLTRARPRGKRK